MEIEDRFQQEREEMVRYQIEQRGVRTAQVLEVMRRVPRHRFVAQRFWERAYADGPLPIGVGQTISQPYIVGAMTDMLALRGNENVLEIGTGSGYQAAVLGLLAGTVHTIERHPGLAQQAADVLADLGYQNVFVHLGDGSLGWPPAAPYQAVLVTAAAPRIPQPLIDQMDEGSVLVIPVGGPQGQDLERWRKSGNKIYRESFFPVAFVPLRGQFGWQDDEWDSTEPENNK
jgi:protein-L-isoaspartate(D-aspartate) O-methyltransferase